MATPLFADLWTNQAGRVIEARLETFDGATVTLARTNGSHLRLPLGSLCQEDQTRVRLQAGRSIAPAFVHAAYRDAKAVMEQFDRLPAERRTDEARSASIRMACAAFDARLKPRLDELKDKRIQEEIRRLRVSLHGQ
jgi:hypothetical protein